MIGPLGGIISLFGLSLDRKAGMGKQDVGAGRPGFDSPSQTKRLKKLLFTAFLPDVQH